MKKKKLEKIKKHIGIYDCCLISSALLNYEPLNDFDRPRLEQLSDMFEELKEELKSLETK